MNGDEYREDFQVEQWKHLHLDRPNGDNQVSVEKLDDMVAVATFAVTILTIALGFVFNL